MKEQLLVWNIYEIHSKSSLLNGVMLRGRIRKLGVKNGFNVLVENAEDTPNSVRFAVLNDRDKENIVEYIKKVIDDAEIVTALERCSNPVLSKLKVNIESRYTL